VEEHDRAKVAEEEARLNELRARSRAGGDGVGHGGVWLGWPHGGKWLRPALRLGPAVFRSASLGRRAFR
jgi:hypothetical protein